MLKLNKQLMNKSTIKFLTDFGPLLVFFIVYYKGGGGLKLAIIYLILATLISLVIIFFMEKKIPMVPLVSCIIIVFFGGLTIYLDNPIFIYIKPTIINLAFAIILISGKYIFKKNLLKIFFQNKLKLTEEGWSLFTNRWAYFFIFLAIVNEAVWRTQTESFWVSFKVWGLLSATLIFTLSQMSFLNKHKAE
jgi:intracellular septation protein|tara:strand:+ start:2143 stop:2715 length:573 start_codon:yes stop_codon:yes gene_type:complete